MQNYQLVGTSVIEPLVDCDSFPDRIKMHTNSVGARYNGSLNNIVTIQKRPGDRFSDAINIYRRCVKKSYDKKDESCGQKWEHEYTKPTNEDTITCR